jgi:capsular exopolysaccharide synthesis family protein
MGEIADALRRGQETKKVPESVQPEKAAPIQKDSRAEGRSGRETSSRAASSDASSRRAVGNPEGSIYRDAVRAAAAVEPPPRQRVVPERQSISRDPAVGSLTARISVVDPTSNASHRYRHMAIRLSRAAADRGAEAIVITSPEMGDGKTTTACNLAIAISRLDQGRRVALVDLDLHRPAVASSLGFDVGVSVADVLSGEASIDEGLIPTDVGGLHVLGSRTRSANVGSLLSSSQLRKLIDDLRRDFSLVILDTPPILVTSDAASILNLADACLLVTSAGRSSTRLIQEALGQVPREKMMGACVNRTRVTATRPEYGYGSYETASAHEEGEAEAPSREEPPKESREVSPKGPRKRSRRRGK